MYYVIHSTDPYLLARMATDLMCEGFNSDEWWDVDFHPFEHFFPPREWLKVENNTIAFHNHPCTGPDARLTLTGKNYLKVLGTIIKAKTA